MRSYIRLTEHSLMLSAERCAFVSPNANSPNIQPDTGRFAVQFVYLNAS